MTRSSFNSVNSVLAGRGSVGWAGCSLGKCWACWALGMMRTKLDGAAGLAGHPLALAVARITSTGHSVRGTLAML